MPGLAAATLAYVLWGLFPLYFLSLSAMDPLHIVLQRTVWSFVVVWGGLVLLRRLDWVRAVLRQPRTCAVVAARAVLLAINWLIYIWAANHGHVIEASLGYFVTPLVNVLLGMRVLGERPRPGQWVALAIAAAGVAWLTATAGRPPWIALGLALSFGGYGLLNKLTPLPALEGLALETASVAPLSLVALLATMGDQGFFGAFHGGQVAWLLCSGPITAVPLLLFAHGARSVPLSTLGTLQYITPSIQFALGTVLLGEPLAPERLAGFALIWFALAVYSVEGLLRLRGRRAPAATA